MNYRLVQSLPPRELTLLSLYSVRFLPGPTRSGFYEVRDEFGLCYSVYRMQGYTGHKRNQRTEFYPAAPVDLAIPPEDASPPPSICPRIPDLHPQRPPFEFYSKFSFPTLFIFPLFPTRRGYYRYNTTLLCF
jgi:hypothetical protein